MKHAIAMMRTAAFVAAFLLSPAFGQEEESRATALPLNGGQPALRGGERGMDGMPAAGEGIITGPPQPAPAPDPLTTPPQPDLQSQLDRVAEREDNRDKIAARVNVDHERRLSALESQRPRRPATRTRRASIRRCPYEAGSKKDRAEQWSAISMAQATANSALEKAERALGASLDNANRIDDVDKRSKKGDADLLAQIDTLRKEKADASLLWLVIWLVVCAGTIGLVLLGGLVYLQQN